MRFDRDDELRVARDSRASIGNLWLRWGLVAILAAVVMATLIWTDTPVRPSPASPGASPLAYDRTRDLATIGRLWDAEPRTRSGLCPQWPAVVAEAPELGAAWIDRRARDFVAMEMGVRC